MDDDDKVDRANEQMFALVGRAITQWSYVEQNLCSIFTICTSHVVPMREGGLHYLDFQVPNAVFYSVENFRSKLGLVDAALINRALGQEPWAVEAREEWAKLQQKVRKLSLKRNRLAHWTVLPAADYGDEFYDARLVPPYGSPGYWRETGIRPTNQTMKPTHIQHLEMAFYLVSQKLKDYAKSLVQREELYGRSVGLTASLIRSRYDIDPTHAEEIKLRLTSLL